MNDGDNASPNGLPEQFKIGSPLKGHSTFQLAGSVAGPGASFSPPHLQSQRPSTTLSPYSMNYGSHSGEKTAPLEEVSWESEIDVIEQKRNQLLNDQWRSLRTDVTSLTGTVAQVVSELDTIKAKVVPASIEGHSKNFGYLQSMISEISDSHTAHVSRHDAMLKNHAERHAQGLQSIRDKQDEHAASANLRLEYLEALVRDSGVCKHEKELESLQVSFEGSIKAEEQAILQQRLDHFEADLRNSFASCPKLEQFVSLQQRTDLLEQLFGETADKHDVQKTAVDSRFKYLEHLLADMADKHAKDMEAVAARFSEVQKLNDHAQSEPQAAQGLESVLSEIQAAIPSYVHQDEFRIIQQKTNEVERLVAESGKDIHTHKTVVESHFKCLERLLIDLGDKHAREVKDAHAKLAELTSSISCCVTCGEHSSLKERFGFVEQLLEMFRTTSATTEARLDHSEGMLKDLLVENHKADATNAMAKLSDLQATVGTTVQMVRDNVESINRRLCAVELSQLSKSSQDLLGSRRSELNPVISYKVAPSVPSSAASSVVAPVASTPCGPHRGRRDTSKRRSLSADGPSRWSTPLRAPPSFPSGCMTPGRSGGSCSAQAGMSGIRPVANTAGPGLQRQHSNGSMHGQAMTPHGPMASVPVHPMMQRSMSGSFMVNQNLSGSAAVTPRQHQQQ